MKIPSYISIFLAFILVSSCSDDVYYDFTSEEKELFIYNEGDTFIMQLKPDVDTLIFEIVNRELEYDGGTAAYITPQTYYRQMCEISFESDGDCMGGLFGDLSNNDRLDAEIFIRCNNIIEFNGSLCDTLYSHTLNNKEYPELYVFAEEKGQKPMLYFTKDEGIVYIDSTKNGNSYSLIEYVKNE